MPNQYVNKVVQSNGTTLIDITDTTAIAEDVASGKYFYTASGERTEGTASGGGGSEIEPKDVVFVDYEGTVIATYTAQEFAQLESLPANPSHTGLTAQGWNWSLVDAKAYVANYGALVIGQNYVPTDRKTHIFIEVSDETVGFPFTIEGYTSVKGGVTVNWGDGSAAEASTANANAINIFSHTYNTTGNYEVTLDCTSGTFSLGYNGANRGIFFQNSAYARKTALCVKEIWFGSGCTQLRRQAFQNAYNINAISIPKTLLSFGDGAYGYVFSGMTDLKCLVFPSGITIVGATNLSQLVSLKYISFGKEIANTLPDNVIGSGELARHLKMLTLPELTYAPISVAHSHANLKTLVVPGTYTNLKGGFCRACYKISKITIPASVTTIEDYAMTDSVPREIHLLPTTPPAISNTRGLPNLDYCTIYVPYSADHSVLALYQNATGWASYASKMQEEPQ